MRALIVAGLLLAGCATGPSEFTQALDATVAHYQDRTREASARLPVYREICRAQMPAVSAEAVDRCARDRTVAEIREVRRQGLEAIEMLRLQRELGRPMPAPVGTAFNPLITAPAVR